jgi:hypothetical protein
MKKNMPLIAVFLFTLQTLVFAQTEIFTASSYEIQNFWKIDTSHTRLYVGASFNYVNTNDSIIVSLDTSDSDIKGSLYFMVPGFKDSAIYLFSNKDTNARVNINRLLDNPIPKGAEIFFRYQMDGTPYFRYTGQNRPGIDPLNKTIYPGAEFVSKVSGNQFGRLWAVAGRRSHNDGQMNDTIVFGFEDQYQSLPGQSSDTLLLGDNDFNDIIFNITGLSLNVELKPDSIHIISDRSTVIAGDSSNIRAEVWSDSAGVKVRSPQLDSMVTWKLTGITTNHDTLIPTEGTANGIKFIGKTAWREFTITARLNSVLMNDTLINNIKIAVKPGIPQKLSIESRIDTNSVAFSKNTVVQLLNIQIPSNRPELGVYALLRDRFGNFIDFAKRVKWDTVFTGKPGEMHGVATASNGNIATGEGIIRKLSTFGLTTVVAHDTFYNLLDSVDVRTLQGSYDSLRVISIRGTDSIIVKSCVINTDICTLFIAQGFRNDIKRWERVPVRWSSSKWPVPSMLSDTMRFCPDDTGSGGITIDYYSLVSSSVSLTVGAGKPVRMEIYTSNNTVMPLDTTVTAGQQFALQMELFDRNNVRLSTNPDWPFSWSVAEEIPIVNQSDSTGQLSAGISNKITYLPIKAYRTVKITGSVLSMSDTVKVTVLPGKPAGLFIEAHADWRLTPNKPQIIDTIEIPDDKTSANLFALIRDSLGNYVDSLRIGAWVALDTLVTISAPQSKAAGVAVKNIRVVDGVSTVMVYDSVHNFADSARIRILPYHYTKIRIVNSSYMTIDSLIMSTNEDSLIRVEALRSDTALWKEVNADWSKTAGLTVAIPPSIKTSTYLVSPVKPGTGFISVRLDSLKDTVAVKFTRGEPVRIEMDILTLSEKIIAGDTLVAVVKIYNKDGLIPGSYCFSEQIGNQVYYQDNIGKNKRAVNPFVLIKELRSDINFYPEKVNYVNQCFTDGVDTLGMCLFYAPYSTDSLHQITITAGKLSCETPPFRVFAAKTGQLFIGHTGNGSQDTLRLQSPDGYALLFTKGFDRFGNYRGEEWCKWNSSGTLHPVSTDFSISRIIYSADTMNVKNDVFGFIYARSAINPAVYDSIYVIIRASFLKLLSSKTRDTDGDGYLDRIELRFDKPLQLVSRKLTGSVMYNTTSLAIDSITTSGNENLYFFLNESTTGELQTSWLPSVVLINKNEILKNVKDTLLFIADDGAGPVIESVVREINDWHSDRTTDLVTVRFSEPVSDKFGNTISIQKPSLVFNTWFLNDGSIYDSINILQGINNFIPSSSNGTANFNMLNNRELTSGTFFSISTDTTTFTLIDRSGNKPVVDNRKVKVVIRGDAALELVVGPNPSRPSKNRERPGEFHFRHNPSAYQWVLRDKGGFVFVFPVKLDDGKSVSIGGHVKIMDMMGNQVIEDPVRDYKWINLFNDQPVLSSEYKASILPAGWKNDGSVREFVLYWNGYASDGRMVAPGVYKAYISLIIVTNGKKEVKTIKCNLGIKK